MSTPKYGNGRLLGHECVLGHLHPSAELANGCDPATWSKEERARRGEIEKQRVQAVKDHPGFKGAVDVAKGLGAADADAEGVVLANGVEPVLEVQAKLRALKIPSPKAAPAKPVPPAPTT